jgi:hypothetical protein
MQCVSEPFHHCSKPFCYWSEPLLTSLFFFPCVVRLFFLLSFVPPLASHLALPHACIVVWPSPRSSRGPMHLQPPSWFSLSGNCALVMTSPLPLSQWPARYPSRHGQPVIPLAVASPLPLSPWPARYPCRSGYFVTRSCDGEGVLLIFYVRSKMFFINLASVHLVKFAMVVTDVAGMGAWTSFT